MLYKIVLFMVVCFVLIIACRESDNDPVYAQISKKLVGEWQAEAFTGQLHETWKLDDDDWLLQNSVYFEGTDTTYRANSKMQLVKNNLILFTLIKNSNPKIFQATTYNPDSIVFQNSDYKNPFKVKYKFNSAGTYTRSITGKEGDSLVTYRFNFHKVPSNQ